MFGSLGSPATFSMAYHIRLHDWCFPGVLTYIAALIFILLAPFALVYMATMLQGKRLLISEKVGKRPPTMPYAIPVLGNLVPYIVNTEKCIGKAQ